MSTEHPALALLLRTAEFLSTHPCDHVNSGSSRDISATFRVPKEDVDATGYHLTLSLADAPEVVGVPAGSSMQSLTLFLSVPPKLRRTYPL
jgi:hypothetical protein